MSRFAVALILLVGTVLSPAARADADADWKPLTGTWKVAAAKLNGEDATAVFQRAVLTIEKEKYGLKLGEATDSGTLAIDPARKPKQMTITGTEGPNKDKTLPAIYEIDGDTLKVCYTLGGKEPPKEFKSTADNKNLLVTYRRDKK